MNGPDILLPSPVEAAPLPEVRNHTPWPSHYFQMLDVQDEVFHVMASRLTFDLTRLSEQGEPALATVQNPLVEADQFYGAVSQSSTIQESDFAPFKPKCDLLFVNARAYAPEGKAQRRWQAGFRIGELQKIVQVTGPRFVDRGLLGGWHVTDPDKATEVALRWEHAYGGTCQWPMHPKAGMEPESIAYFDANPLGCGWVDKDWHKKSRVVDVDAPQIERFDQPFKDAAADRQNYPSVGVGAVGRWWLPRRALAGTYDQAWKETRWPRLPLDFDFGYWNCAPPDQQIDYPEGGEDVALANLQPGGTGLRLNLPRLRPFVRVRLQAGPILPRAMNLDTLVFDMAAMTLSCVFRMTLPARAGVRVLELCSNEKVASAASGAKHGR